MIGSSTAAAHHFCTTQKEMFVSWRKSINLKNRIAINILPVHRKFFTFHHFCMVKTLYERMNENNNGSIYCEYARAQRKIKTYNYEA